MEQRTNDRRSVLMIVTSMLVFGTIGVFRRSVPVSSAFLAFSRGILGGLCILLFIKLKRRNRTDRIPCRMLLGLMITGR